MIKAFGWSALLFAAVTTLQVTTITLMPATKGLTAPLPTICALLSAAIAVALISRLIYSGIELGILIPLLSAVIPLVSIAVDVVIGTKDASVLKVGLLTLACVLIGVATKV